LCLEPGESALAFVTRIKSLVRAAKADDMGYHLSELIFHALPLQGQEMIMKTYPNGPGSITEYTALLELINANRSMVTGDPANPLEYVSKRWAKHLVSTTPAPLANNTRKRPLSGITSTGSTTTNKPHVATSVQATATHLQHQASNNAPCTHVLCKTLNLKHSNGQCLRKSDRDAWRNLIITNQVLVDKIKAEGKWPQPFTKVSAPVHTTTIPAAAVSVTHTAKKRRKMKIVAPAVSSAKRNVDPDESAVEEREDMLYDFRAMENATNP
ncbi:hypothetical protein BGZ96_005682, partial [Linnemannia gamsii]